MALSSNSIIHFTKQLGSLQLILKEGFKIKYCRETLQYRSKKSITLFAPMTSFCDIPLSEIKNHIKTYGEYGIGLKKSWAEEKGLNPVLYLEKQSSLLENLLVGYRELMGNTKIAEFKIDGTKSKIADVHRYLKNYQGTLKRDGKPTIRNYRFSDEREWRYVPSANEATFFYPGYFGNIEGGKELMNTGVQNLRLGFRPVDIRYLILKDENEIHDFIVWLNHNKDTFNMPIANEDIIKLQSRIITVDQILHDF